MSKKTILFLLLSFVLGFIGGGVVWQKQSLCKAKFQFINSDLACDTKNKFDKSNPIVLKTNLTNYIDSKKGDGSVSEVSIYFRDLKYGPILGIDENELFISASLLKLPIAVTLFRLSEDGEEGILDRNLLFQLEDPNEKIPEQFFPPSEEAVVGQTYLVGDLIYRSLAYSDNWSNEILKTYLLNHGGGRDLNLQTFKDLGLIEPASITTSDISTRNYASIFRILFNASYLSRENSEKVLSILSESEFDMGIAAGVPSDIKLANKFGERDLGEEKQLHDCGIVYFPDNPYLLCVMTRGEDFNTLTSVIKDISGMVYKEMEVRSQGK